MEDEVPPTISVSSLRWSTCGDARKVALNLADDHDAVCAAKVIEASFKKFGCVCIPVSDLAVDEGGEELLRRFYNNARRFFLLPEGQEPAYVKGEKQLVESFSCTKPLKPGSCKHVPMGDMLHNNLFPDSHIPGFGDTCSEMWTGLQECIALPILRALELILTLPRGFLLSKCRESDSVNLSLLRTLYYPPRDEDDEPPCPCPPVVGSERKRRRSMARDRSSSRSTGTGNGTGKTPAEVGISDHTDFEVVTVMHQNRPGLWLRSPGAEGSWYEMPFRQDVFTVILGDMVERWTAGWLEATRHRVVSPQLGQAPRQSLVLFQAHDDEICVKALKRSQLQDSEVPEASSQVEKHQKLLREVEEKTLRRSKRLKRLDGSTSLKEWLMNRPRGWFSRYPPVKQGTWVRQNELKAKKACLASS